MDGRGLGSSKLSGGGPCDIPQIDDWNDQKTFLMNTEQTMKLINILKLTLEAATSGVGLGSRKPAAGEVKLVQHWCPLHTIPRKRTLLK